MDGSGGRPSGTSGPSCRCEDEQRRWAASLCEGLRGAGRDAGATVTCFARSSSRAPPPCRILPVVLRVTGHCGGAAGSRRLSGCELVPGALPRPLSRPR